MAVPLSQVFFPSTFQELFSAWSRFPGAVPYAGGTGFIHTQGKRIPVLPKNIISLDKLEELHRISRTERYLEIGAMVKLNQIIHLGKIVPDALTLCLQSIGGPHVRNMVTIGGNICFSSSKLDCSAPMIALDAQYELRNAQSARWIPASRFSSLPGQSTDAPHTLAPQELLTRIRIPLEPWTFTWHRKFSSAGSNEAGGTILFIMRNQRNILTNIRILYSGNTILREKNSETLFLGKRLPLNRKDAITFVDLWKTYLSTREAAEFFMLPGKDENTHSDIMKTQIINFVETMIMRISE